MIKLKSFVDSDEQTINDFIQDKVIIAISREGNIFDVVYDDDLLTNVSLKEAKTK